jgi:glycosyltransferase involved in cell wall biosynthesis
MGEDYPRALQRFAQRVGVGEAVRITGMVSAGALAAYYRVADVFVCASEHEGFCVPVVEAMHLGLPVVAHASAALPETVGEAGLVLSDRSPLALATAAHRVVTDSRLRDHLVGAGRARARAFSLEAGRDRMVAAMAEAAPLAASRAQAQAPAQAPGTA